MRLALFSHSLLSDWNHGNAHFLRGLLEELASRGVGVTVFEPRDAWSVQNLVAEHGEPALFGAKRVYPHLDPVRYDLATFDLERALAGHDVVLVHEWSDHDLVRRIGELRARTGAFKLLFHDTHHRAVTDAKGIAAFDLRHYDGVLAFGQVIRDLYVKNRWSKRAWTFHEAADARVFKPIAGEKVTHDLVWIGNWGDEERTAELHEFLLRPVKALGLKARVYGVRYPDHAKAALAEHGIEYGGWLPNYEAPLAFARARVTVHVPRRPYVEALPGIPTIRPFEALACGIPLVTAPWSDAEHLFTPGEDFLVARDGAEMQRHLQHLLSDESARQRLAAHGRATVLAHHTCAHRADQLFEILAELDATGPTASTLETA